MVRTRNAILPDVEQIHAIIRAYSGNGTLLPRTLAELRENVRDFVVAEDEGKIVGCGALHLYGMHLAEIRSIAVTPSTKGLGAGRKTGGSAAQGSRTARSHMRLPVYAHPGILFPHGIQPGQARRSA